MIATMRGTIKSLCQTKYVLISIFVILGVDPKSVFCAFFKQGLCKKGADKCKFSHDPDVERKSAKRILYTDVDKDKENEHEDKLQQFAMG